MIKNIIIIVLIIIVIVQFVVYWWKSRKNKSEVTELISYLTLLQDNLKLPQMKCLKEGNMGILQSEIYKVVALLREAYTREASRKKEMADMLSNISHQIKTPIAAILIMVDLLESSKITDENRLKYVGKIDKQAGRISWLIKNLLALSQLEAGVLELKKDNVVLVDMLENVKESLEIMSELKEIQLDIQAEEKIKLICDRNWTLEAIFNIVKNAMEHTKQGGKVMIRAVQDHIATHIYIEDDGKGIGKEQLQHIFERFYTTGKSSEGSIGIGLSMAKQIILKQNGIISVQSVPEKGTEFYIKIYNMETL